MSDDNQKEPLKDPELIKEEDRLTDKWLYTIKEVPMESAIKIADEIMAGRHSEESYEYFRNYLRGLTDEAFLSQASFIIERYEHNLWDRDYVNLGMVVEKVALENSSKAGRKILKKLNSSRRFLDYVDREIDIPRSHPSI